MINKKPPSKKTPKYASVDPAVVSAKIVDRDGRFEKYASGVVHDTKTGLEWYAGPDKDISGNQARLWVARLKEAGGGWRMPTRKELKTLYQKSDGKRNMTPLLKTNGWDVWSGGIPAAANEMWYFSFYSGRSFTGMSAQNFHRSFAVRS